MVAESSWMNKIMKQVKVIEYFRSKLFKKKFLIFFHYCLLAIYEICVSKQLQIL